MIPLLPKPPAQSCESHNQLRAPASSPIFPPLAAISHQVPRVPAWPKAPARTPACPPGPSTLARHLEAGAALSPLQLHLQQGLGTLQAGERGQQLVPLGLQAPHLLAVLVLLDEAL